MRMHPISSLPPIASLLFALAAGCGGVVSSGTPDGGTTSDSGSSDGGTTDTGTPGSTCGGLEGRTCPAGMWCSYPDGTCHVPDAAGTCRKREALPCPPSTPGEVVCGCDSRNYGSACEAHSNGQSVAYPGTCKGPPPSRNCGGSAGTKCASSEFCDFGDGTCPAPGSVGNCLPRPLGCPDIWAPVCGCDGKTYSNGCDAHSLGVTISTSGECGKPKMCGGFTGETCSPMDYCDWGAVPSTCGGDDGSGVCKPRPLSCVPSDGIWCGCDGKIYESRCAAAMSGQGVRKNGPC